MFTGLIEEVGIIVTVARGRALRIAVQADRVLEGLESGGSVAVSGPCLTADQVASDRFWASLLPETMEGTTLGLARQGTRVNLERPMRLGERLGGHLVSGHVDGLADVTSVQERGATRVIELLCPPGLERYLVDRGSVALDGVSLTVRAPAGRRFAVALVPETLAATTLDSLRTGDRVNIEADLLAKHVERLLSARRGAEEGGKLADWLAEAELSA
jgi:riboflavin synthase